MPKTTFMDIDFQLQWKSSFAEHTDSFLISKIDIINDVFPVNVKNELTNLSIGNSFSQTIQAKDLLGEGYSSNKVITFDTSLFNTQFKNQVSPATLYRFYPSAIAWQGLGTTEKDYSPFRLMAKNNEEMIADCNHPLAKYYLTLKATKLREYESKENVPKKDIGRILTERGPGMQAPFEFGDSVFFDEYPFKTSNKNKITKPAIDLMAVKLLEELNTRLLAKHSKILDVVSDDSTYLDKDYRPGLLTGIGANEELLSSNERLDTYIVQDLNKLITLPFEDNSFDDAICSLSIEYLTNPLALMNEIARVVNSKGKFIVSFTDKFIMGETISLWSQLHPFERIQLVLEYFRKSGLFSELNTFSKRGVLKSSESIKSSKKPCSNIYAVWGTVK